MKKIIGLMLLVLAMGPRWAQAEDVAFRAGGNDFILPLKDVSAVQLYSFDEGRGYPAIESVLVTRGNLRLSVGAAAILGTGVNVPFASISTRLSETFFDISDNGLYFGLWVGKPSDGGKTLYGVSAQTKLW